MQAALLNASSANGKQLLSYSGTGESIGVCDKNYTGIPVGDWAICQLCSHVVRGNDPIKYDRASEQLVWQQ